MEALTAVSRRGADGLRHVQGGRPRHAHRRHPPGAQGRRQVRHLRGSSAPDDLGRRSAPRITRRLAPLAARNPRPRRGARPRAGRGRGRARHPAAAGGLGHGRLRRARRRRRRGAGDADGQVGEAPAGGATTARSAPARRCASSPARPARRRRYHRHPGRHRGRRRPVTVKQAALPAGHLCPPGRPRLQGRRRGLPRPAACSPRATSAWRRR